MFLTTYPKIVPECERSKTLRALLEEVLGDPMQVPIRERIEKRNELRVHIHRLLDELTSMDFRPSSEQLYRSYLEGRQEGLCEAIKAVGEGQAATMIRSILPPPVIPIG